MKYADFEICRLCNGSKSIDLFRSFPDGNVSYEFENGIIITCGRYAGNYCYYQLEQDMINDEKMKNLYIDEREILFNDFE